MASTTTTTAVAPNCHDDDDNVMGLETCTCLEPQVCFYSIFFFHFTYAFINNESENDSEGLELH
jgi:hypothetical protein